MLDSLHSAARATRMNTNGRRIHSVLFFHIFLHSLFVIGSSFPFHKGNRTGGAGGQAIAQTIAIIVPQEFCLPVYHADSPFMAGFGAGPTSIALFFVYLNNFPNHVCFILSLAFLDLVYYNMK